MTQVSVRLFFVAALAVIFLLLTPHVSLAQKRAAKSKKEVTAGGHRIVFQLVTADTLSHKGLMRQLNNVLNEAPDAKIEVVCHGPGLDMLVGKKTVVGKQLTELTSRGVVFQACENTLKERKIDRADVLPLAGFVRAGIIHIVEKQEQGWSYIKAGM